MQDARYQVESPEGVLNRLSIALNQYPHKIKDLMSKHDHVYDCVTDLLNFIEEDEPGIAEEATSRITTPDGEVTTVPTALVDAITNSDMDEFGSEIFNMENTRASEVLCKLRFSGYALDSLMVVKYDDNNMARYFLDGLCVGADSEVPNIFHRLTESVEGIRKVNSDTKYAPGKGHGELPKDMFLWDDVEPDNDQDPIDFSKGECQYISGSQSDMLSSHHWREGLSFSQIQYCEKVFRALPPRKRIEKLREVLNTELHQRKEFSLRNYKAFGVTVLFFKERALTFGWSRKLPKSSSYTAGLNTVPRDRDTGQLITPLRCVNSFHLLERQIDVY